MPPWTRWHLAWILSLRNSISLDVEPPAPETPRKSGVPNEALFASMGANDFEVCFLSS
ncbi:hypothetical protein ACFO0S_13730 [Chryseomicrobium palamuruense]|uniref:Uncharacterized protein n=1 Tax=Chryseomicrobium palamuruense TaxID=682973 RepID=A0ABV8UZR5_9BACL